MVAPLSAIGSSPEITNSLTLSAKQRKKNTRRTRSSPRTHQCTWFGPRGNREGSPRRRMEFHSVRSKPSTRWLLGLGFRVLDAKRESTGLIWKLYRAPGLRSVPKRVKAGIRCFLERESDSAPNWGRRKAGRGGWHAGPGGQREKGAVLAVGQREGKKGERACGLAGVRPRGCWAEREKGARGRLGLRGRGRRGAGPSPREGVGQAFGQFPTKVFSPFIFIVSFSIFIF